MSLPSVFHSIISPLLLLNLISHFIVLFTFILYCIFHINFCHDFFVKRYYQILYHSRICLMRNISHEIAAVNHNASSRFLLPNNVQLWLILYLMIADVWSRARNFDWVEFSRFGNALANFLRKLRLLSAKRPVFVCRVCLFCFCRRTGYANCALSKELWKVKPAPGRKRKCKKTGRQRRCTCTDAMQRHIIYTSSFDSFSYATSVSPITDSALLTPAGWIKSILSSNSCC